MARFMVSVQDNILENEMIIILALTAFTIVIVNYGFKMVEMVYVMRMKKPLFVHRYWRLRKLTNDQRSILSGHFVFYNRLSTKEKKYFEHRLVLFIKDKDFIGREGLEITDEVKLLASATAIMLTFGFRDFYIGILEKICLLYTSPSPRDA